MHGDLGGGGGVSGIVIAGPSVKSATIAIISEYYNLPISQDIH